MISAASSRHLSASIPEARSLAVPAPVLWVAAVSVLIVAAFLRLYGLSSQGFMHWDEGLYALEGQFLADTWKHLIGASPDPGWVPTGRPPVFMRPFHSLLISIAMLAGGVSAGSALLVPATSGVLTVVLVLALGWRVYSPCTGVLAAAFLATMPLHVVYSRQVLSEADGALFATLSLSIYWLSLRSSERRMLALATSGFMLGLGIATNMRLYFIPPVFALTELWLWLRLRQHGRLVFVRRSLVIGYSFVIPLLAATLFFWWLERYYQGTGAGLSWPIIPYLDQFAYVWNFKKELARPLYGGLDLPYYAYVLWNFAGPALVLSTTLFFLSLVVSRDRTGERFLAAAWLLVPLLLACLYTDKAPRYISVELPIVALAGARGIVWTIVRLRSWPTARYLGLLPSVLATIAVAGGLFSSATVSAQVSGYPQATAFALDHGVRGVVAGQPLPVEFFANRSMMVAAIPDDSALLASGYRKGYSYVLVDDHAYLFTETRALAADIESRVRPVASFPDTLKGGPLFFLEYSESMTTDLGATLDVYAQTRTTRGVPEVRVYDLREYLQATGDVAVR